PDLRPAGGIERAVSAGYTAGLVPVNHRFRDGRFTGVFWPYGSSSAKPTIASGSCAPDCLSRLRVFGARDGCENDLAAAGYSCLDGCSLEHVPERLRALRVVVVHPGQAEAGIGHQLADRPVEMAASSQAALQRSQPV